MNPIETYCDGYPIAITKIITENDLNYLCQDLGYEYNKYFKLTNDEDKYNFTIDLNTLNIQFSNYPNKKENGYKAMRLIIKDNKTPITETNKIRTFLKAFRGAPIWTLNDLQIFDICLSKIGFNIDKYPAQIRNLLLV